MLHRVLIRVLTPDAAHAERKAHADTSSASRIATASAAFLRASYRPSVPSSDGVSARLCPSLFEGLPPPREGLPYRDVGRDEAREEPLELHLLLLWVSCSERWEQLDRAVRSPSLSISPRTCTRETELRSRAVEHSCTQPEESMKQPWSEGRGGSDKPGG